MINLAWLSGITHLCCLTFLRENFRQSRGSRWWRMPGMVILVNLLSIAYIPAAQYIDSVTPEDIKFLHDASADYAICFKQSFAGPRKEILLVLFCLSKFDKAASCNGPFFSAIILVFGMLNRVWRLYKPSTNAYCVIRRTASEKTKKVLTWADSNTRSRLIL